MGRSIAEFLVPNVAAHWVLESAYALAGERRMRVEPVSATEVLLTAGKSKWIGIRRLRIAAEDAPGGAKVRVEARLESFEDMNADPNSFLGMLPRRQVWDAAAAFVARLGVSPLAVFHHEP